MDISFDCDKCGKHLVVDEAGSGITIDCPGCGKPVYVPSAGSKAAPQRVEVGSTSPKVAPYNPLVPPSSRREKSPIHPSIEGGLHCLLILMAIQFVGFMLTRQNLLWAGVFMYTDLPFVVAPLLCAVYAMCVGHVRHGLLILTGLALIIGLSYCVIFKPLVQPSSADLQRQMEEVQGQMGNQFKQFSK